MIYRVCQKSYALVPNKVVRCSAAQLKHTLRRNISAGHSQESGRKTLLTDSVPPVAIVQKPKTFQRRPDKLRKTTLSLSLLIHRRCLPALQKVGFCQRCEDSNFRAAADEGQRMEGNLLNHPRDTMAAAGEAEMQINRAQQLGLCLWQGLWKSCSFRRIE